jgi:hypothetical protein
MTQQAVTVLVPEHPAANEKPAEPGASGDEALLTGERADRAGAGHHRVTPVPRQPAKPGGTARPGLRRQPARRLWF